MRQIIYLVAAVLVGCGGGGSSPEPAVSHAAACTPIQVTVNLFGDSTMAGYDGANLVTKTPAFLLQEALDARFGRGNTLVVERAVGSTTAPQFIAGADGRNQPWPLSFTGQVAVINHGINDATHGGDVATYRAALETLARPGVIFETPNQVRGADLAPFAQVMRDVAAEHSLSVADTYAKSRLDMLSDWAHPTQAGYEEIVSTSLAPAVIAAVAPLRCE